jgi:FKBP-type peptidyl-prolyl cis-trans isomerase
MKTFPILLALAFAVLVSCNKGTDKNVALSTQKDSVSYALGIDIATNLKTSFDTLNLEAFYQGIKDIYIDTAGLFDDKKAQEIIMRYMKQVQDEKSKPLIAEGEKFLTENAKKEGVKTTQSGLQYEVISEGTGNKPALTDEVSVNYTGTLIDGTVFDSNKDKAPVTFPLNGVIPGWSEGIQLMNVGSKYKFYIPYNLAYGERGAGNVIKPYSTLIFEVELLSSKKIEENKEMK